MKETNALWLVSLFPARRLSLLRSWRKSLKVVPWFPFLTAADNPEDAAAMLHEMGTAGVGMAALVTVIWLGMLGVGKAVEKRPNAVRLKAK